MAGSGGSSNGSSSACSQYHKHCKCPPGKHRHHGKCVPNKPHKPHKPPKPHTKAAHHVKHHSAKLKGTLGTGNLPTTYYFQYGACSNFPQDAKKSPKHTTKSSGSVSFTATGLKAGTKYCYRLVAHNRKGTKKGKTLHFKTKAHHLSRKPRRPGRGFTG